MTETQRIQALLRQSAPPEETEILADLIGEFLAGGRRREMLTGQRYYQNETDILSRYPEEIGRGGVRVPGKDPVSRIAHGFVRKLVDQKAQYLFGRPFTVRCGDARFAALLNGLFDQAMRAQMRALCKEAVNKGVGWLQAWPDGDQVRFTLIPSEEVLPVWKGGERGGELERVLRLVPMERYIGRRKEQILLVRDWSREGVQDYRYESGKLIPEGKIRPHFTAGGKGMLLDRLPFIPFRYNDEEIPLIRFIKPLIDDYDLLKSQDSDNLLETGGSVMVLHNYDGTDLGQFRENLSRYRAVKVSDGGGLDILHAPVHTGEVLAHLNQDRRDLYEIGRGVDTQSESFGNSSGVAIKFRYADLDLDCAGIESAFAEGFDGMVYFAALFYGMMGKGDFSGVKAEIILNRDILISESDAVEQCAASREILSARTVLENHPWVTNVEEELKRLSAEGEKKEHE